MKKKQVSPNQIALFPFMNEAQPEDKRPLPLIVADNWNFSLQSHATNGKTYYAVQDWISGVGQTSNPRDFWGKLKKRLVKSGFELSTLCLQLPYIATNGKTYQMDYASDEALYFITQRMDTNTGLRDKILIFLAKSGAQLDKYRLDGTLQEISDKARAKGIESRNKLTDAAKDTHVYNSPKYAALTATEYHVLFKTKEARTAKNELVLALGLDEKQATKFRDHISHLALQAMSSAESAIASKMYAENRQLSDNEQLEIVRYCCRVIAPAFHHLAQYAGVDLLSGKPLLNNGGTKQ